MADDGNDQLEELFAKELERLIAANEELEIAPPEEPESVADAFAIATSDPVPLISEPPASDPLLTPPGLQQQTLYSHLQDLQQQTLYSHLQDLQQ